MKADTCYYISLSIYLFQLSHVNLNNMLCPAVSDPFYGRLYRICGMIHQIILIPLIGKFIAATASYFKLIPPSEIRESPVFVSQPNRLLQSECAANTNNGNSKTQIGSLQNGNQSESTALSKETNGYVQDGGGIRDDTSSNGHIKKA